jgi:hypothetical protein
VCFAHSLFCLQQLPITRKSLKVLPSNTFKDFLGLGLSAKRCNYKSPLLADNKKMMTGPETTISAKQVNWKIN